MNMNNSIKAAHLVTGADTLHTARGTLEALFDALSALRSRDVDAARIVSVTCEFSGGGDEGGVTSVTVAYANGVIDEGAYPQDIEVFRAADAWLVETLDKMPSWLYGSFAGEFSVNAQFTLDVDARTISVDGTEQHTVDEPFTHDTEDFLWECERLQQEEEERRQRVRVAVEELTRVR
jgi:hypothetical protein